MKTVWLAVLYAVGLAGSNAWGEPCTGAFLGQEASGCSGCGACLPDSAYPAGCDPVYSLRRCIDGETEAGTCLCTDGRFEPPFPGCSGDCPYGCSAGETRSCDTGQAGICGAGSKTCTPDRTWGSCTGVVQPTSELCNGLDDDCDGSTDQGLGSTACGVGACEKTVENCVGGAPQTCEPGPPAAEACDDGVDDDCDGVPDDGCGPLRDGPGPLGGGGTGGGPPGGATPDNEGGEQCQAQRGNPVDLTSGNVTVGPITIASVSPPVGLPLELSLTYNSRRTTPGKFGTGWTSSWEERIEDLGDRILFRSGTGGTATFPAPEVAASPDTASGVRRSVTPRSVTTARESASLAFYRLFHEVELCRPQPGCMPRPFEPPCPKICFPAQLPSPRVLFSDGSLTGFAEPGGHVVFREDRVGNWQSFSYGGLPDLPTRLEADGTALQLGLDGAKPSTLFLVARDGASALLARFVITGGYLTDILVPCAPAGTAACPPGGERTAWHFEYAGGYLTAVRDETGQVVESHVYQSHGTMGVIAVHTEGPQDKLDLAYSTAAGNPFKVGSVTVTQSHGNTSKTSETTFNASFDKVASIDASCACSGGAVDKTWVPDASGRPRLTSMTRGLLQQTLVRTPGAGSDPSSYDLPVLVTENDLSSFASPSRSTSYAYLHPLLRRPTKTSVAGTAATWSGTTWDFDDDDSGFPCIEGAPPVAGDPDVANESPTQFLCRIVEQGGDPFGVPGLPDQSLKRVTRFRYDIRGRLKLTQGPSGEETREYWPDDDNDPRAGRLQLITRVGGAQPLETRFADYHASGKARTVTGPNAEQTKYELDVFGRVTAMETPEGPGEWARTEYQYARGNDPSVVVLPRGGSIHYTYGAMGRLQQVEWRDAASAVTQRRKLAYDPAGNPTLEETWEPGATSPTTRVQRDYDEAHHVVNEYPLVDATPWRVSTWENGALSQVVERVSGASLTATQIVTTRYGHDGFGRLRKVTTLKADPATPDVTTPVREVSYGYDGRDNLTSVTDGNGNVTSYLFDGFGRMRRVTSPNAAQQRYDYDEGDLLTLRTVAGQRKLRHTYDGLRRLHQVVDELPATPVTLQTNTYDEATAAYGKGRLTTVETPGVRTRYGYDLAGRLATEQSRVQDAGGTEREQPVVAYGYHPTGAVKTVTYPSGQVVTTELGATDQPASVDRDGTPLAREVTHHPFGGLKGFRRGNERSTGIQVDQEGRITSVVHGNALSLDYTLNARGDVVALWETDPTMGALASRRRTFTHDALAELTSAQVQDGAMARVFDESYTYDRAGNRQLKTRAEGTEGGKAFVSVFDLKADGTTPANDLLRAVIDPRVAPGGECVPRAEACEALNGATPFFQQTYTRESGQPQTETATFVATPGPGLVCVTSTGVPSAWLDVNGAQVVRPSDLNAHPQSLQVGVTLVATNTITARLAGKAGESLTVKVFAATGPTAPVCKKPPKTPPGQVKSGWNHLMAEADRLLRLMPGLSEEGIASAALALQREALDFMAANGLEPKQVHAVLFAQSAGGVTFGDALMELLRRRAAGEAVASRDVELLRSMLDMARAAPIDAAGELDPTWTFAYDAFGNVVEERSVVSPFELPAGSGNWQPGSRSMFHSTYDALGRVTEVRYQTQQIVHGQPAPPMLPVDAEATLAQARYDAQNRRVWFRLVQPLRVVETFYLYGQSGELLAETEPDGAGVKVLREHVWLEGQALAQVLPLPLTPRRPPSCTGAATVPGGPWVWLVLALLVALAVRSRKARPLVGMMLALWLVTCTGGQDEAEQAAGDPKEKAGEPGDPVYYYDLDRLGTPVRMTDEAGRVVWRAEYRPFGDLHSLEMDPDADGVPVENDLRFPGQYDDGIAGFLLEQGPYYNWHRYYSPGVGRYLQPEPMLAHPTCLQGMGKTGDSVPAYAYA